MLRDNKGSRLFRRVEVQILYPPEVFKPQTVVSKAEAGKGFSHENIDEILMSHADRLEELYPFWDFRLVVKAPSGRTARYALIFSGYRPPKSSQAPKVAEPSLMEVPNVAPSTPTV